MIQGLLSLVWNAVTPSGVDDVFCCLCHIQGPFLPFMSASLSAIAQSQKIHKSMVPLSSALQSRAFF